MKWAFDNLTQRSKMLYATLNNGVKMPILGCGQNH